MTTRAAQIAAFLARNGWGDATRRALAGDASQRRYERLDRQGRSAVLMDAPPETGEDVRPFIAIDRHLRSLGFAAPEILAEDPDQGFLLLEDLGDALFARQIARDPAQELPLYQAATDLLIALHQTPPPDGLERFSPDVLTAQVAPVWDWYLGEGAPQPAPQLAFQSLFLPLLQKYTPDQPVMILRDFHAENLIWLPQRSAAQRVGLLDFQDAKAGATSYDLVSLLQDARRDVSAQTEAAMIAHYCAQTQSDTETFALSYALMGCQRNLRILGVLTRLCLHLGKAHYVDFLPRVWRHLMRDLDHPSLAEVKTLVLDHLQPPTQTHLDRLKSRCPTP